MEREPIGVLGAGWVGLVTAASFAALGHRVVVRDVSPERIAALQEGRVPIHEPGLAETIARNRDRLAFTLAVEDVLESARIVFVCVGTPSTYSGDADLSAVWQVVDELAGVTDPLLLVMKSTVPVGTGERVRTRLDERGLENVGYVANPEFLSEGTALADFAEPDRVVVGAFDPADAGRVAALYGHLSAPVLRTDVPSAEMIKLASNAALMTRISFINEIANVCELVGADVEEVARGIGLDHRVGPHFLRAGIGYGGSCFPKDASALKQLAANSGYHFQLLSAVIDVNELQRRRVVQKLQAHLGQLNGRTVALLGLAFKPGTNDLREAPSLVLAPRLLAEGAAVRAWDPVALESARGALPGVELADTILAAVAGADAAVIVTDWPELRDLASPEVRQAMRTPLIVDGRNLLDPAEARAAGFAYEGIGRPAAVTEIPDTPEPAPGLTS
ncbi:MAG TPA: UDP-glucose/GDP-mannose dehydrogenase family protein [Gaiellaceae bacterium]|nr:UDP-glucose/GDP-mannose dehydrogenase family protein [Gaiellaceae bacterium]